MKKSIFLMFVIFVIIAGSSGCSKTGYKIRLEGNYKDYGGAVEYELLPLDTKQNKVPVFAKTNEDGTQEKVFGLTAGQVEEINNQLEKAGKGPAKISGQPVKQPHPVKKLLNTMKPFKKK